MNDELRPIDANGHVPDEEPEACCAECLRDDPAYKLGFKEGYEQALLAYAIAMLENAQVDATALRERLERLVA